MSTPGGQEEERIIAASKRPDGTYRKERRVRAGYIPQDEQPVYQSKGALFKQNVPKCPGMDDAETAKKPMSKSAKKNAKRKDKKEAETDVSKAAEAVNSMSIADNAISSGTPPGFQNKPVVAHPHAAGQSYPTGSARENGNAATPKIEQQQAAGPETPQDIEKQLRNLRKKIRQAESTGSKAAEGKQLTAEEQEKLHKLLTWQEEEKRLAALQGSFQA